MERFHSLLLGVWREACKHISLTESVERIAPLLARRLPVGQVVVRRIELPRSAVETAAAAPCDDGPLPELPATPLDERELERLLTWCRRGGVRHFKTGGVRDRALVPGTLTGDVLAGPLNAEDGPRGVLLLAAHHSRGFTDEHAEACAALLDPFVAAMENDRRLRELNTLREAAEADKRSLLTRLGREDLADTIVGAESGLREVMERVELVAGSDVPVLLLGETGSGKEVAARAIHMRSRRGQRPFLRVNCGAIPPELIDSELFGHERGSFTGAESLRQGWFERADSGTLFLDEVGELPPAAQVRLLRVLQDGTFERVGGQRQLHADVRLVAATHRDLQAMVGEGRFRQDLWYRIAVFPVRIPPLRERPSDIPALATHFALKAARRFGVAAIAPTPADISRLISYPWPGNVRELGSVMERAVILGHGRTLEVATALGFLPPTSPSPDAGGGRGLARAEGASGVREPITPLPAPGSIAAPHPPGTVTGGPPPRAVAQAEPLHNLDAAMRAHIEAALRRSHGRVEGPFGAATLLSINPHTLRSRMRKLGVRWADFRPAR